MPDFLTRKAPPNYIAGLGRGATGFTTRSDIGPAREAPEITPLDDARQAEAAAAAKKEIAEDEEQNRFQDPDNETGLFSSIPYEADDEEADRIYEAIDRKMEERRKSRKEREAEEMENNRKERPKIQEQFSDLKRQLTHVTEDEWSSIPEVGDLVRRRNNKKAKISDKYTPVPDSVLLSAQRQTEYATTLDTKLGIETPATTDDSSTDFAKFGQARDKVLGIKLDQMADSVSGQSVIDPKGYLTDLSSVIIKTDAEISDIKKARTLLRSVISTNPNHAPGWIAAARLEEVAGKQVAARELIAKGCEACAKSEDIWLEAARLNSTDNAKIILANAIRSVPTSVKVWLKATDLETETRAKKRVLRRALEFIPNSVKIWKAAIEMEAEAEDAKILLSRAVECVPLAVELWLALARLETYENAKKVLNKATKQIPTSHEIWIAAARLEDTQNNEKMVDLIMKRALEKLSSKGAHLDRELWIKEAENCEKDGFVITCQAIIRCTLDIGVDEEDRKSTWMEDAESCAARGSIETARVIYAYSIKVFPHKKSVWRRAAFFEKAHGTRESLEDVLQRAVQHCPQAEVLWLMGAKEKWIAGDIAAARGILQEAFKANQNSEQIWLAAIKLEVETGEYQRGRALLEVARTKADTEKVWMKSAVLERVMKNTPQALSLLKEAILKFPNFTKLWLIKGQIEEEENNDLAAARTTYNTALRQCAKSIPLWISASRLEEKAGLLTKGRAVLEKARLLNPKDPELWSEAIRLETRGGNAPMARALMAKALQECPDSGLLWSQAILMEARPQRKARSADALRKCENNPLVLVTVARLFWADRKVDKARNWFNRAIKVDADMGDSWAWCLRFEMMHGEQSGIDDVVARCVAAEPHHGERWQAVSKKIENFRKTTKEILMIVAAGLPNGLGESV